MYCTYKYIHTHACMLSCCTQKFVCMGVFIYIYIYVYISLFLYVYMYIYICALSLGCDSMSSQPAIVKNVRLGIMSTTMRTEDYWLDKGFQQVEYKDVCTHLYRVIYVYIHVYVCVYVYIHMYVCMYVCM